ncbi:MAG: inverse autotransporter beta domain-containing protein [Deltaproteobacteria bacterium]|nr:inverse autotransporter beta domain-containing protein [Candidatus Zymogenaceae bacterium]
MSFRRFFSLTVAFWLLAAFVIPVSAAAAADDSDAWTIYFRPGTRFGTDDRTLFILDFLVPIYQGEKNILFFNPRLTPDDHDGLEVNLGLGYRHLLFDDKLILGGNVFYDNRRTGWGTRWEQVGVGAEAMAELNKYVALTGRFNYYFPLTGAKVSGTGGPATGYYFRTGGIWIGGGGLAYEESPEGFDGELGVRIPFVSDYVETWVYGGGYHYHGSHVGTIDGWTARLEVIPTDFLRLAYEYRDDNTTRRGDHYGEVTFEVPFSIENLIAGKNPFEGLGKRLSGSRDMKERLVEPVRRDVDIRIVHGGSAAGGAASETLAAGVVFVSENGDDTTGDGSFENPFNSIGRAVTAIIPAASIPGSRRST